MVYDIRDYGAIADGTTLNTKAIQAAIDACHNGGGGQVSVENGTYMFGTVILRSNVELHIAAGATLLGSPRCEDYPERENVKHVNTSFLPRWRNACYIYAEESENIAITGLGTIDCNGKSFVEPAPGTKNWLYKRIDAPTPPRVVFFAGCKNVKVEDIMMINQPAGWSYWIHDCDYVTFDKVKIFAEVEYPNNDGIHINSSRNVTISNCDITCGDDCIVVRANNVSLAENKVCERVAVTNCNLTSYSGGIRVGWMNDGVIRNCTFSNLVMTDTSVGISMMFPYLKRDPAFTYTSDIGREATLIKNISFDNIIMDKTYGPPIKIEVNDNEETRINCIENIYFNNIHASGPAGIVLKGREANKLKNIRITNSEFVLTDYSLFKNSKTHGVESQKNSYGVYPFVRHCDRVLFDKVEFKTKNNQTL